jgi:hypothetical protein
MLNAQNVAGRFFLSSGYYPSKPYTPLTIKEFDFALACLSYYNYSFW